jgi:PKHD-type hydroxylase
MTNITFDTNDHLIAPCVIRNFLTAQECSQLIDVGSRIPVEEARIGKGKGDVDTSIRASNIRWLDMTDDTRWIFSKTTEAIKHANNFYKFDIQGMERFQITEYPAGGHFDWHTDITGGRTSNRKLSLSVQLSDPDDYSGGNLEFVTAKDSNNIDARQQGTAIIFPSYLHHRVTEITAGTRWSIIAWVAGPPFR